MSPSELQAMIAAEVATLRDPRIADNVRSLLVAPYVRPGRWDYGAPGQTYPCWIVLKDGGVGIAYCAEGFGPRCPWGLVFLEPLTIGTDAAWYRTFLEPFFEGFATDLPIWQVFEQVSGTFIERTDQLEWDEAWARQRELIAANPGLNYLVMQPLRP